MAEPVSGSVQTSIVETDEQPFIPGPAPIKVVLRPTPPDDPYVPPFVPIPDIPPLAFIDKTAIVDIETTGLNPWDSRIISIGVLGLEEGAEPIVFFDLDEEKMVKDFLDHWVSKGYNTIIGYNTSFDHRFVFAKALKYRIKAPKWTNANLIDVMQILKQVQERYVFGFNKPGSMGEWAEFLLGRTKLITVKEIFKAWEDKRYQDIIDYNLDDLDITKELYALIKYVREGE